MTKQTLSALFFLLLLNPFVWGQQILNNLDLSPEITNAAISGLIVVTNDSKNEWLVAWNQNQIVKGRIVKPNGQYDSIKKLAKGPLYDAAYDSIHHTYLILLYDGNRNQLRALLLSGSLKEKGVSQLVRDAGIQFSGGISGARAVFDPVLQKFLVFWIEITNQNPTSPTFIAIKRRILDAGGKPISEVATVLDGGTSTNYDELRITRNPQNGYIFLNVSQFSKGLGSIVGYTLQADGTLLRNKPVRFSAKKMRNANHISSFFSIAETKFNNDGTGISTWATRKDDNSPTKFKSLRITDQGTSSSKSILIAEDNQASLTTTLVFDPDQNEFLVVWRSGDIVGVLLDPNTGDVVRDPFSIARPRFFVSGLEVAYEGSSGNILVVWKTECHQLPPLISCPNSVSFSQVNGVIFKNN